MNFKQYLQETVTPKQNIIHFQNMKPKEFLEFAKYVIANNNHLKNIKTSLKVDGCSGRFGKDSNGNFFFETGRSGIIQTDKAFSTFTKAKSTATQEMITRSCHYDDIYSTLKKSDIWKDLPNNSKIICEILYNPMAEIVKDKLKFVTIAYPKNKLGNTTSIIPISVIGEYDIQLLYEKSNNDIKIISPELSDINIKLDIKIDDIDETILTSLKQKDKSKKQEYIEIIQELKNSIAKTILKNAKISNILGDDFEGIVIEINNKLYKITSDKFKILRDK